MKAISTPGRAKMLMICLLISFVISGCAVRQSDPKASRETAQLYKNLLSLSETRILFGHQDDLAYGVSWKYQNDRSDVKELTGEYPALFGWEIAGLEKDALLSIDSVPFSKMKEFIIKAYDMGAVNTITWHLDNPLNGASAWDTTMNSVAAILPGGSRNGLYTSWLDKVAVFIKDLKGSDGNAIPIIFRPFHELSGNWFWWGKKYCSPEEYKQLWRFTKDYLSGSKGLHNLLYAYNMADFENAAQYMERYPGDEYVDIMSFDAYQYSDPVNDKSFSTQVGARLDIQDSIARKHHKIPAFAETGYEAVPYPQWWTEVLQPALEGKRVAYVLVWRNAGARAGHEGLHYYAPYNGQVSAPDFLKFYLWDRLVFEEKIREYDIYR